MAMDVQVDGSQVILVGTVDGFDYVRFLKAVNEHTQTVVLRDSPGGDADTSFNVGREIHQRKLRTVAKGFCRSGCAIMFMAGVERRLADAKSYVVFHGGYVSQRSWPSARWGGELMRYFAEVAPQMPDDLVELIVKKPRRGGVWFYLNAVWSCEGTEEKQPSQCERLKVTALEVGVVTTMD